MKLEKKKSVPVHAPVVKEQNSWYKNRKIQMKIGASIAIAVLATLPVWQQYIHPDLYIALENLLRFVINIFDA